MDSKEQLILHNIMNILSEKSKYNSSSFSNEQINLLIYKLLKWPEDKKFPSNFIKFYNLLYI